MERFVIIVNGWKLHLGCCSSPRSACANDRNAYEIAKEIDVIQTIGWIKSVWKEVAKYTIKNCFANCAVVEQPRSIDDAEDVDEELNNLFEGLSEEQQIDGDIAADEFSNFDHEVCISFPPINSDEVDWRRVFVAICIQEQGANDDTAIKVESDGDNDEASASESNLSQIIPPEVVNFLDRLVHVDGMCVDDTNDLLTICEKMTILIIQQERQTYIGDFLPKN